MGKVSAPFVLMIILQIQIADFLLCATIIF